MKPEHISFVVAALIALRRASKATRNASSKSPTSGLDAAPLHLKCVISQELFEDPVVLCQTGHSYERDAIVTWLATKALAPTDPITNVPLWTTDVVPNWSLRDAVNAWRASQDGGSLPPLRPPAAHCKPRASPRHGGAYRPPFVAVIRAALASPAIVAFAASILVATLTCAAIALLHAVAHVASRVDAGVASSLKAPLQSIAWWICIFSLVWIANGGHRDPIRDGIESRHRRGLGHTQHHPRHR